MFKKRLYGYLGDEDAELTFRANTRCGGNSSIEQATFSATAGDVTQIAASAALKIWVEALDDTLAVLFYYVSGVGIRGSLLSRSGMAVTELDNRVVVTPAGITQNIMAAKLSSTKVLLQYTSSTTDVYAVVVDVTGGTTLSPGSGYAFSTGGINDSHPRVTAMTSSRCVSMYGVVGSGILTFRVLDVSGTVVTVGAATTSSTIRGHADLVALSSSKFIAAYEAFPELRARVGNITGSTITLATESGSLGTYGTASASARTSVEKISATSTWLSWGGANVVKSVTLSINGSDVPSVGTINTTSDSTATNITNCFNTALLQSNKSMVANLDNTTKYPTIYGYRLVGGVATRDTSTTLESAAGKEISVGGMTSDIGLVARTRSSDDRLVVQVVDLSIAI